MFRHRITIQKRVERRNTVGEVTFRWEESCTTWAMEIKDRIISIRYQPELYPGDRVVIGDSYFEIIGVIDRKFRKGRLVELHISDDTGRKRVCLSRFDGEQQCFRASIAPAANASNKEFFT